MKAVLKSGSFSNVSLTLGGSKSESNRLLILQALFPNLSIENLSTSDDTQVLTEGLKATNNVVDVHHAGTAMRFLTAYFASKQGSEITLTGSQRMQERPIGILVDALKSLGAEIEYLNNPGFPPLKIIGKKLENNTVKLKANISSQYISALILIAPTLPNGLQIVLDGEITSRPYLEMTLSLLQKLGIETEFAENTIYIPYTEQVDDATIAVESDWSSASYFYSLASLSSKSEIQLSHFFNNSLQGDSALVSIYKMLGVETQFVNSKSILISKKDIVLPKTLSLDLVNTPDLAQTIAVSCFGLGLECRLTGLHTLKIKETDRLEALKTELEKLGGEVEIDSTSLHLFKSSRIISNQVIDTYQDHRMAMAFAPLSLKTNLTINDAEVVSKSYPGFWKAIGKAGITVDLVY